MSTGVKVTKSQAVLDRLDARISKPGDPLTPTQAAVFRFIVEYIKLNSIPPSVREIAEKFGWGPNGVMGHLIGIEKKGVIVRRHKPSAGNRTGGQSRTIRLVSGRTCRCCGGLGRILDGSEADA